MERFESGRAALPSRLSQTLAHVRHSSAFSMHPSETAGDNLHPTLRNMPRPYICFSKERCKTGVDFKLSIFPLYSLANCSLTAGLQCCYRSWISAEEYSEIKALPNAAGVSARLSSTNSLDLAKISEAAQVLEMLITLSHATPSVDIQALYYIKLTAIYFEVSFSQAIALLALQSGA